MQISGSELKDGTTGCCGGNQGRFRHFTMDTPLPPSKDFASMNITRVLGHAVNNKALAGMKPGQNTSPVMTRANNLASLTAAMLLQVKPTERSNVLIRISGLSYAQHVLNFTEANPAKLDVTDALRFSLALNFMLGILDFEAGKHTFLCEGYSAFARLFKDAQDRRAGREVGSTARATGLSGLGQLAPKASGLTTAPAPVVNPLRTKAVVPGTLTSVEQEGYTPPAAPTVDWNSVGRPAPLAPAAVKSRDLSGACIRWTPGDPCYPAPPDQDSVALTLVQADACGLATAGGNPFATLQAKQRNKLVGVRKAFTDVFARPPNNTELEYYAKMRYCASADPKDPMTALVTRMIRVREAMENGVLQTNGLPMTTTPLVNEAGPVVAYDFEARTAFTDIGDSIAYAAAAAFDFLGKVAEGIANILCAGFKALFGPVVGGVICDIITYITNSVVGSIGAIVDIIAESLDGTFQFIKLMVAGKVEDAFVALLRSMGRVIFSLSAPMMVPILMMDKGAVVATRPNGTPVYEKAQGPTMAAAFAELKKRADRVTLREPLWPIMVVMAVVGLFSAASGNVLGALTTLITALAPMVATFISEPLRNTIRELGAESVEAIEGGIIKFIKFILLIFNGAMSIKSIIPQFRAQMASYFSGKGAGALTGDTVNKDTGVTTKANAATRIKYVLEKLTAGIDVITRAFKDFNVKDIMKSAGPLLMLIPDLLLAILPDDAKVAMPSLTEWKDAVKQSEKDVNKQEAALKAGAADIFNTFSLGTKISTVKEQVATTFDDPTNPDKRAAAAATAAAIIGTQFKNKTTYPQFTAAFRAELLKV